MGSQGRDTRNEAYVAYRAELVRYATPILGSREDAEDIVQEAFVRFVPEAADEPSRLKSYLYRIVRNLAFDTRRRRRLEARGHPDDTPWWGLPQNHDTPEEQVLLCDRVRQVEAVMEMMPTQKRIALEMHRFGGYRIEEIARHLGVSTSSAHRLIQSGLAELLKKIL
ncbi:RNA polymerase sigma factor [Shinella oryzae]|uniref:RNA polymerase sigma factor n=1 Tax=Shinella oryzae TaxID=2871820 RepID=A0ABY9KEL8_9HYPH|nr:RNA polymerase sigma factor [Shinella oryzae]WLS06286.1 RNA polymerase sigma factor [Shinella oryzae]